MRKRLPQKSTFTPGISGTGISHGKQQHYCCKSYQFALLFRFTILRWQLNFLLSLTRKARESVWYSVQRNNMGLLLLNQWSGTCIYCFWVDIDKWMTRLVESAWLRTGRFSYKNKSISLLSDCHKSSVSVPRIWWV